MTRLAINVFQEEMQIVPSIGLGLHLCLVVQMRIFAGRTRETVITIVIAWMD